jgi:hypothetical protein
MKKSRLRDNNVVRPRNIHSTLIKTSHDYMNITSDTIPRMKLVNLQFDQYIVQQVLLNKAAGSGIAI